jgi:hypothetical protein
MAGPGSSLQSRRKLVLAECPDAGPSRPEEIGGLRSAVVGGPWGWSGLSGGVASTTATGRLFNGWVGPAKTVPAPMGSGRLGPSLGCGCVKEDTFQILATRTARGQVLLQLCCISRAFRKDNTLADITPPPRIRGYPPPYTPAAGPLARVACVARPGPGID